MVYLVFSHHRVRIFSILPWSLAHFLSDFTRTYQSGVLEHSLKITGFGEEYVDWTSYERSIRTKKHTGRNLMSFGGSPEEKTTNDTSAHNRTRGRTTRRRLRLISYFTSAIWCEERWTKRIHRTKQYQKPHIQKGSRAGNSRRAFTAQLTRPRRPRYWDPPPSSTFTSLLKTRSSMSL